jgi:2-iminoacetate synthase ThiH
VLVEEVLARLRELGADEVVETQGEIETTVFRLPDPLIAP